MKTAILASSIGALLVALVVPFVILTRDMTPPILDDFSNSAALPFDWMTVNVDITENDTPTLPGEASVFYSTNGQASWTETLLTEVVGYVGGTWEASFPVADGDVHYYFMVHDDSAAAFGSPVNSADVYPAGLNLMADPADEPLGDVVDPDDNCVDLDGARFSYSDNHIYGTLSNATGSWPLNGGLFGPWYIYSVVIDNPDAASQDVGFALVYADVPLMLDPGLYVVDLTETTYTLIGDIDYVISGGDLHLRCDLADLYAHPDFGPDNPSGYYLMGGGTATATLNPLGAVLNDMTNVYAYYHRTELAAVGTNTPPVLSDPGYEVVSVPGVRETEVNFFVTYSDADGHLPVERNVVVDDTPVEMGSGPDHDYAAGVQFELALALADNEDHVYYFSFSDGVETVETDPDTIRMSTAVAWSGEPAGGGYVLGEGCPNPFTAATRISYSVPVASGPVVVGIYDVAGRLVREVVRENLEPGLYAVTWDGRDETGRGVASGVYFLRMEAGGSTQVRRLVFVK